MANEKEFAELVGQNPDFVALRQLRKKWQTKLFVDTPYDFLILLLVMMMGALGGMVRTIRLYGDPEHMDPKPKDYFLFPLIGMVVAIGGFVLAKTGLLLLSTNGGEAALSPFMIGLVGIISGLLAKEVIDSIADKGRKVLAGDELPAGSRGKSTGKSVRKSAAARKGRQRAAPAKQPAKKAGKAAQPAKGRGSA